MSGVGSSTKFAGVRFYHGTDHHAADDIVAKGFLKPKHLKNWLGCGVYFSVDNYLLAVSYAEKLALERSGDPVVFEIGDTYLQAAGDRVLDLTSDRGILKLHDICKEFAELIEPGSVGDIGDIRESPIYDEGLAMDMSVGLMLFAWLAAEPMKVVEQHLPQVMGKEPVLRQLDALSKTNLSSVIIDWWNYYQSRGDPNEVPVKVVLSVFNTGDPVLLKGLDLWSDEFRRLRRFYDHVNFLAFDYYTNGDRVAIKVFGNYDRRQTSEYCPNRDVRKMLGGQEDRL